MRFPTSANDVPPRVRRAIGTVFRQVPHLASYAANLSVEAAGALREQVQHRLGRGPAPRDAPRKVVPRKVVPSAEAFEAGAPGTARAFADRAAHEQATAGGAPSTPEPDELPISDWDHASMPSLRARVARLSLEELLLLRAYETEHAARLAVLTMLDNRIAKVDHSGR